MSEDNGGNMMLLSDMKPEDFGNFYIFGGIDETTSKEFLQAFHKYEEYAEGREVKIYINSYGGELYSGWAITDAILSSSLHVTTIALGKIMSAATMIFLGGDQRQMQPHASWMSHQYSEYMEGKYHEFKAMQHFNDTMHDDMVKFYKKQTKLNKKQVLTELLGHSDHWLSAEQCLELGICHEII